MKNETQKALSDALSASQDIQRFTSGIPGLDGYERDRMIQAAVERKFEIVGEALSRAKSAEPALVENHWLYRRFIEFGDIITHGVEVVSNRTVWQTAQSELPILMEELRRLLESPRSATP